MRLFIAVNFNKTVVDWLERVSDQLREHTVFGSFSRRENYHLTLAFLGELQPSEVERAQRAMDTVEPGKIRSSIRGIGRFRRDGGDIYWIGVEKTDQLEAVQRQLANELRAAGFDVEDRPYRPHLTLARQVTVERGFDREAFSRQVGSRKFSAGAISLMLSERVNGALTYTEIYRKEL